MTSPSRRTVLGSTAALLGATAGCIDQFTDDQASGSDPDESPDGDNDETDSDDSETGNDGETGDGEEFTIETHQYQRDTRSEVDVARLTTSSDVDDWLADRDLSEEAETFVDETSFDESVLVALEAEAPNLCYEMVLETSDLEDEVLSLEAAVSDEAGEGEYCAQQVVTVGVLVRATFDDEPVTDLNATIVDQDGTERSESFTSGSATDSEDSASDSGTESDADE
ncbi:hypothetical protein [Halopiger djelfimassiliensis]|uniref:hypothetical protein n=1 Tax=Halopiger djelfimassiliensis TaxID=1293047 RepID=UPI000677FD2F|nr:hypothetical protein [Halopiger djelfimassiliensis]